MKGKIMSISSVSCTPIKPQVSFGSPEGVDEAQRVLQLSRELNDSFHKEDEEVTIKHPLQTAVSLIGAGLAMYTIGRGAGKAILALAKKTPANVKSGLKKGCKSVSDKASGLTAKLPVNEKLSKVYTNTIGKVAGNVKNGVKNAVEKNGVEKVFTTATGALAAATLVPKIAKADGNGDGIADIAQKNVNAYTSAFKTAEIFADMINAVS